MASPPSTNFYIGLFLAASSSIFIGSSFIVKKKGLLKLQLRAGQGGFGYLKEGVWWAGFLLMGVGEGANFLAYAFAPATLVTPLGALSVLVSAILASHFLQERLNLLGKLGCLICLLGSTVIVIHSPKEAELNTMEELLIYMANPFFILYTVCVAITVCILIFTVRPQYGQSNPLVYITITGTMGSLSVMGCKGLGVAIKQTLGGENQFTNWLTWFVLISVIFNITVQMNYLNKALDIFNTAIVTPILYVVFTSFVILASCILFKEWERLGATDIVGNLCGFLTIVAGVFLLQAFKDLPISWNNLPQIMQSDDSQSCVSKETAVREELNDQVKVDVTHNETPKASYAMRDNDNEQQYRSSQQQQLKQAPQLQRPNISPLVSPYDIRHQMSHHRTSSYTDPSLSPRKGHHHRSLSYNKLIAQMAAGTNSAPPPPPPAASRSSPFTKIEGEQQEVLIGYIKKKGKQHKRTSSSGSGKSITSASGHSRSSSRTLYQ